MPRAGWVKTELDHRLSDHLSWGLLTRVYPPELVDRVLARCGRVEQRSRLLPSQVVTYYVMGLALFSQASYEEVMRMLVAGQVWAAGHPHGWSVPTKAALFKARARLGSEPLAALFAEVAVPLADVVGGAGFYGPWRLMTLDHALLDVPDTPANEAAFGRPDRPRADHPPLPQVQVVGVTETGSRAIVDAATGGLHESRAALGAGLLDRLPPDALLLAGRSFGSLGSWTRATATGAELLWRLSPREALPMLERHADGSYASRIFATDTDPAGVPARIVEHTVPAAEPDGTPTRYRLATTITDPAAAHADDLAVLYSQRWAIASAFDELKAHHLRPRVVLRSKMPDGVRQEVFGYLCVHYAVRWLMHGVRGIPAEHRSTAPDDRA